MTSYADSRQVPVVVDTRDQAAMLNAAIRGRPVAAGRGHDKLVVTTAAGERIRVGDRVATRRNDRHLDVVNRDVWIVTGVGPGRWVACHPRRRHPDRTCSCICQPDRHAAAVAAG